VSDYLLHELAAPLVIDETLSGTAGEPFVRAGAKAAIDSSESPGRGRDQDHRRAARSSGAEANFPLSAA
jgi:hypothetical protein